MNKWLDTIMAADEGDLAPVLDAEEYFTAEVEAVRKQLDPEHLHGQRLITVDSRMGEMSEYVARQWAVLNAIVETVELRVQKAQQRARKMFTEAYNRELGTNTIEKYAAADDAVLKLREVVIRLTMVRNLWEAMSKGLERLSYTLRNSTELRKVGLSEELFY